MAARALGGIAMCGIYGLVGDGPPPDRALFTEMDRLIFHRGPDDSGLFLGEGVALGARRLAIQDLSAAGHQPMQTDDGRFTLVYNGEVYNFPELRAALVAEGHTFRSGSDTEVVLKLLARHGAAALPRFSGMFALALWDRDEQTLLVARDRFGQKPLYLYRDGARLAFASELRALLAMPNVDRALDLEALGLYLTLGFVPGPRTLFAKIRKAAPATAYTFARGRLCAETYWRLTEEAEPDQRTEGELLEDFEARLKRVVARHLLSDVPVGIFLSGGLDSSALVVAAHKLLGRRSETFTIGFDDPTYSEAAPARLVAQACDTVHHELTIAPDAAALLPRIVSHLEEPLADTSILPLWSLSQLARAHVTVALSGDGGDETLGGYTRYLWAPVAQNYGLLPSALRQSLLPRLGRLLPGGERRGVSNVLRRVRKFIETGRLESVPRYLAWFALFSEEERERLLPSASGDALAVFSDLFRAAGTQNPLRQLQYVDIHSMLADNLLLKGDKLSMAHSLETRAPFLDPDLAEFGYRLDTRWKLRGSATKVLLRRWLATRAPESISRRPKQGFEVPVGRWFRGDLAAQARELLLGGVLRKQRLLDEDAVLELLRRHGSEGVDLGQQIFGLLVLEHFFRAFEPTA